MNDRPAHLRLVDNAPIESGTQITWLAHLGGRGDYFFPVPGVVVTASGRHVRIAVQVFGGDTIERLVRWDSVLPPFT